MNVGDKDEQGRTLKLVRGKKVLTRSRQVGGRARCETKDCGWTLESKNAMGVGSQHAATRGHKVVIEREVITEYDAETPA